MEEFWKDDFRPLQWAGKAILQALREDEESADADIYGRLAQSQEGSHLYFRSDDVPTTAGSSQPVGMTSPSNFVIVPTSNGATNTQLSPPSVGLKHRQSLPLPPLLTDALKQVRICSFMGLLLAVDMAWMTVDGKLFLFSSDNPAQGTIQCFENPRKQPFLGVALVKPKEGVFKEIVEWCLVLTTPEEVILLALARVDHSLKIIPTSFLMPTDLVRMACAAGTDDGRIFLGGDDGCVHEMVYEDHTLDYDYAAGIVGNTGRGSVEDQLNQFYDGTATVPDVVVPSQSLGVSDAFWKVGKRTWQAVSSSAEDGPRKCRKLNHTMEASSLVTALIPNVVRQASTAVFGGPVAQGGGRVTRLAVDYERNILYSLSEKGWITVLDIARAKAAPVVAVCDVPKTARLYLEAVSRGQMYPPSSSSATVGVIHFPGGGAASQAGVGGMAGARQLLKQIDRERTRPGDQVSRQQQQKSHPIITPVALHVVPCQDSSRLTLVAVTGGGLRLYLSSLSWNAMTTSQVATNDGNGYRPLGSRLGLCHIRSPPPLAVSKAAAAADGGASVWSHEVSGGMLPGPGVPRVDASHYRNGQWVVAIEDSSEVAGSDVIVCASPDTARRPREGSDGNVVATGGLGESISFPIGASHENGRRNEDGVRALSGGLVWEIDEEKVENSGALQLLLRSPTPSNIDLEAGLPPAYLPPPQIRHRAKLDPKQPLSESRAIVPESSSVRSQAFQVMTNLLLGVFLSRPLNYQLRRGHDPYLGHDQPVYRVSKRNGMNGFSMSASERRRAAASRRVTSTSRVAQASQLSKSARLRTWLLQPSTKPLTQWTTQYLLKGRKSITALNVNGIHKFESYTVLNALADALMVAGDNAASDTRISSFFKGFGYKEGCAMCLVLAIGCGPAEGKAGYNQQLKRRASEAALARAYKPRLLREDQKSDGPQLMLPTNATDTCVPQGYSFKPSSLHDGLLAVVSRLLRPVWHKPLVVVTEGRSINVRWGSGSQVTSVKVEMLLDDAALEQVLSPLESLLSYVKGVFSRAVDVVPGNQHEAMEIDSEMGQQHTFTQALQYHSQFRSTSGETSQLTHKECDNIAHQLEERNIHSTYRLVSRVDQLLRLLKLLRGSESMAGLPQVDWGLLHGATVAQLVQSAEGHERVETLLNELVVGTASGDPSSSSTTSQADHLADELSNQCYLYFPPSSRFAYQGLRLANEALSFSPGSSQRRESAAQAATQLVDAARYWHSASLVSGRLVRGSGNENYFQIAARAMRYSSPLARAADVLMKLEDVSSVVEVCLRTSQNFKAVKLPVGQRDGVRSDGMFAWEADLYHKRIEPTRNTGGEPGPTTTELYGNAVAPSDAIDTCYALVFFHLDGLLRSGRRLADHMVSACLAVPDKTFLTSLFAFLIESSNTETLLRLDSAEAEAFLRQRDNPDLLWRYYNELEKFVKAGHVASTKASADGSLALGDRIEWLTRALESYRSAQNAGRRSDASVSDEEISRAVSDAEDSLNVAMVQNRILQRILSLPESPPDIDPAKVEALGHSLISATSLYNDFAAKVPLFDLCLVIFHMCRYDDAQLIRRLWKNALCDVILPCGTRDPIVLESLQNFAAEVELADGVSFVADSVDAGSLEMFEGASWATSVQDLVIRLGKEIYGNGADYTFPVDYLMEQLRFLSCIKGIQLNVGWSMTTLAEAGVPFLVLFDAHESLASSWHEVSADETLALNHLSGSVELFRFWISRSKAGSHGSGKQNAAHAELSRAMSAGALMPKLNVLRSRLEQMQGGSAQGLAQQVDAIEQSISFLVSS